MSRNKNAHTLIYFGECIRSMSNIVSFATAKIPFDTGRMGRS